MDEISGLPDDVLLKILSFLPTKEAVSTSILSKRWEFLWMWLPRLEFIAKYVYEYDQAMCGFINKNLPLQRAPVIERLHLILGFNSRIIPKLDVKRWVEIAVTRHVRDLKISYYSGDENFLSSTIFTCKSLVILKLKYVSLMDAPSMVCLPSLKILKLKRVKFGNEKSLQQLLSNCPLLEDLLVYCDNHDDDIKVLAIIAPSLQRLSLSIVDACPSDGYVIDTPSLKYLKVEDRSYEEHYSLIKNMPKLREAFLDIRHSSLQSVIGSITSVKRLTICCCSKDVYGGGCVFNQLEHLKLCVCQKVSLKLLAPLLNDSPNLRVLEFFLNEDHWVDWPIDIVCLNQLVFVPECFSSLQIFKWSQYLGSTQERDIAVYILENACHLKTATILTDPRRICVPHLQIVKELTLSSRASSTCELVFVEDFYHIET